MSIRIYDFFKLVINRGAGMFKGGQKGIAATLETDGDSIYD
jgi:hypothetical protein